MAPCTHSIREVDAEVVLHQAADEERGGLGVERHADPLAFEVLRGFDVLAVDHDEAVAKHPRGEHRQRDERQLFRGIAADELGARHLAGVEFQPVGHAVENLARIVHDEEIQIDALGFDVAGLEREHAIVEAAGEGDRQRSHEGTFRKSWGGERAPLSHSALAASSGAAPDAAPRAVAPPRKKFLRSLSIFLAMHSIRLCAARPNSHVPVAVCRSVGIRTRGRTVA